MRYLFFLYLIIPVFLLFKFKYKVAELDQYNRELMHKVAELDENIRLLKANWTYLNNPKRIERLAIAHLGMEPIKQQQIRAMKDNAGN